ncbi:MAG: SdrD B-like domain-containing protein [Pseudomonadota bacterium]
MTDAIIRFPGTERTEIENEYATFSLFSITPNVGFFGPPQIDDVVVRFTISGTATIGLLDPNFPDADAYVRLFTTNPDNFSFDPRVGDDITGTLTFPLNQQFGDSFAFTFFDDADIEPNETITITFTEVVSGSATIDPTQGSYTFNILDDDGVGTVRGEGWYDINDNGIDDGATDGFIGDPVTVELLNADGTSTGQTTTLDQNDEYEFTGVAPGDYRVRFDLSNLPNGFLPTLKDAGADDTVDSDVDPTTRVTDVFTVNAGDIIEDLNLGVRFQAAGAQLLNLDPLISFTSGDLSGAGALLDMDVVFVENRLSGSNSTSFTFEDGIDVIRVSGLLPGDTFSLRSGGLLSVNGNSVIYDGDQIGLIDPLNDDKVLSHAIV